MPIPPYPWANPYIDAGYCADKMTVAATAVAADAGSGKDGNNSFPGHVECGSAADAVRVGGFTAETIGNQATWSYLAEGPHTHFTSATARDAFALAMANATSDAAIATVTKTYQDSTVGGNWGTLAVAP